MPTPFLELENSTKRLYEAGEFRAALTLLDAASATFPDEGHQCKMAFFRACLLAKDGDPEAALDGLETALDHGLWWSEPMLADPDLDACRGERLDRIIRHANPTVEAPACHVDHGQPGSAVLLALHGGGEVVTGPGNPWAEAVDAGWTVYRPVSTQRSGAGLATWTDLDTAVDECRTHLEVIGPVNVIGSFSLGGSLTLRLITEIVSARALMIAPSLRTPVVDAAASSAHGTLIDIVTGERDPFLDLTNKGVARLRAGGADVRLEVVPGIAHDFPPDFGQRLTSRLGEYLRRS